MDILKLPDEYERRRDIQSTTKIQLVTTVRLLARFAGGSLDTTMLSADFLNRWLLERKLSGLQPETVRGNRTMALMLWRLANEIGEAGPVERVRVIKVPDKPPRAFTRDEIQRLIEACQSLHGRFRRLPIHRRVYFESFFMAAYDTALRLGDLLALERSNIWPGGYVSLVQRKTCHAHRAQLRQSTLMLIEECMAEMPGRKLIWPQFARRKRFYEYFRRLVRTAGIRHGTSKWLRRSSATYIAAAYGEIAAQDHLGHRTAGLARRSYIDQEIAPLVQSRLPPSLWG